MNKKIEKQVKDHLMQLEGIPSWSISFIPVAFGFPSLKRKKIQYFLYNTMEGVKLIEYIERQIHDNIWDDYSVKAHIELHYSTFCEKVNGLNMQKYGF